MTKENAYRLRANALYDYLKELEHELRLKALDRYINMDRLRGILQANPPYLVRGIDYNCEQCEQLKGSFLENGFYRCKNCGYPGK